MKDYTQETRHCSWWGGAGEALPIEKVQQLQNERDQLLEAIKLMTAKIKSATICHPNAVQHLLSEALQASSGLIPCEHCNGSGDVHGLDGEWKGECICKEAGK